MRAGHVHVTKCEHVKRYLSHIIMSMGRGGLPIRASELKLGGNGGISCGKLAIPCGILFFGHFPWVPGPSWEGCRPRWPPLEKNGRPTNKESVV